MAYLSSPTFLLKVFSALLLIAAAAAWFTAGRMALKRKLREWSGVPAPSGEGRRTQRTILILRVTAAAGLILAVIAWIAMGTIQAYQDA